MRRRPHGARARFAGIARVTSVMIAGLLIAPRTTMAQGRSLSLDSTASVDTTSPRASRMRGQVQRFDLGRYGVYDYRRPVTLRALREVPATVAETFVLGLQKESLPEWGVVAVSTLALYGADEYLLDKSRLLARHVGLPPTHPSINLRFAGLKLPIPTTIGSAIYFLGDGTTDLLVAGGFLVQGWRKDDNRARTTASEITSGLVSLGVYTQMLKRAFGRQTPNEATEPRGRWRPFPPLGDYNANVPAYDAMPSGHMAAAMSTVEIVALNYPEKHFVRPLGYSLMTLLGFAMVNNGVHWASDYPMALLIGGGVARVTVARGRTAVTLRNEHGLSAPDASQRGFSWTPLVTSRAVGVRVGLPY
ncbi:MAG: phosphatase PAP2 family protein [Gemmatimonadota bacterium]